MMSDFDVTPPKLPRSRGIKVSSYEERTCLLYDEGYALTVKGATSATYNSDGWDDDESHALHSKSGHVNTTCYSSSLGESLDLNLVTMRHGFYPRSLLYISHLAGVNDLNRALLLHSSFPQAQYYMPPIDGTTNVLSHYPASQAMNPEAPVFVPKSADAITKAGFEATYVSPQLLRMMRVQSWIDNVGASPKGRTP
jgi:hypothetical protein